MNFGNNMFGTLRAAYGSRHEPEGRRALSDFYWHTLLATAFLVSVLVFLYSTWFLLGILEGLSSVRTTMASPPPPLNKAEFDATVRGVEERKAMFDTLQADRPPSPADPSR